MYWHIPFKVILCMRFMLMLQRKEDLHTDTTIGEVQEISSMVVYIPVFPPLRVTWSGVRPQRQSSPVELHIQLYSHCKQRGRMGQNGF